MIDFNFKVASAVYFKIIDVMVKMIFTAHCRLYVHGILCSFPADESYET